MSPEIRKELAFERALVEAGGLLVVAADPTGNGSALVGYADQRNLEILVDAEQLGLASTIGSIAKGKQADLVVLDGNPITRIADIENVKLVFKDRVAYHPARLTDSIRGHVGLH